MGGSSEEVSKILEQAWLVRLQAGVLPQAGTPHEAGRVFYGVSEGQRVLDELSIDVFGEHAWVTTWGKIPDFVLNEVCQFLLKKEILSAVILNRPEEGVPDEPAILFGEPPAGRYAVSEFEAQFYIQLLGTKHPGLFLDHEPLRAWLLENCTGRKVLNTFSYTGSLSIASALGGADQVTSIDLSRPATEWAKENWELNELPSHQAEFIVGDVFDWLERFRKKNRKFEVLIVDPPTFSRGPQGAFSTEKNLKELHEKIVALASPGAYLVSSINSQSVSFDKFKKDVFSGIEAAGRKAEVLEELRLPKHSFPVSPERLSYLKGLICSL